MTSRLSRDHRPIRVPVPPTQYRLGLEDDPLHHGLPAPTDTTVLGFGGDVDERGQGVVDWSAPTTSPDLPKRQAAEAPPPQRSAPSPRLKLTPTWANDKPQRCRPRPGAYLGCGTDKHSPRQYTPTTAGET